MLQQHRRPIGSCAQNNLSRRQDSLLRAIHTDDLHATRHSLTALLRQQIRPRQLLRRRKCKNVQISPLSHRPVVRPGRVFPNVIEGVQSLRPDGEAMLRAGVRIRVEGQTQCQPGGFQDVEDGVEHQLPAPADV